MIPPIGKAADVRAADVGAIANVPELIPTFGVEV